LRARNRLHVDSRQSIYSPSAPELRGFWLEKDSTNPGKPAAADYFHNHEATRATHWVGCVRTETIVGLRLRQLGLFAAAGAILVVVVVVVVADVLKLSGGAGTAPKAGCLDKGLFNDASMREV
jgi:hypothetical protein